MIKRNVRRGFDCYNLYQYYFGLYMFNPRYANVSYRLKKKMILKNYLKNIRGQYEY